MSTKVYAARDRAAFAPEQSVQEHGGFYIATTQDGTLFAQWPRTFEIVAKVDDEHIEILHNSAAISYDDMFDMMVWATTPQ